MRVAPSVLGRPKFRELIRRWDWLLTAAITPMMLLPNERQVWLLFAIMIVLVIQWANWREVLPVTPLNPAILLLAIMACVSIFITPDLIGSLGKITGLLYGMAVYFCVARHTRTKKGWQGALVLFILAGIGMALLGLADTNWETGKNFGLSVLTSHLPVRFGGLPGAETGIHPNELGGALLWIIPVIFMAGLALLSMPGWFNTTSERIKLTFRHFFDWAAFLIVAFLVEVGVIILTQSRGSYLALALTGLVLLVLIPRWPARWWAIGMLIVLVIGGAILVHEIGWGVIRDQVMTSIPMDTSAFSLNSLSLRVEIWSRAIWAIKDVPLTGMGMNVFRSGVFILYPTFQVLAGYNLGHAHNELLQAALDLGLPGLVGFLALYVGALGMLYRSIRTGGAWRLLALGLMGGLLAHFIFGITDAVSLGAKPGILLWWLLGMVFGLYEQSQLDKVL